MLLLRRLCSYGGPLNIPTVINQAHRHHLARTVMVVEIDLLDSAHTLRNRRAAGAGVTYQYHCQLFPQSPVWSMHLLQYGDWLPQNCTTSPRTAQPTFSYGRKWLVHKSYCVEYRHTDKQANRHSLLVNLYMCWQEVLKREGATQKPPA